NTFGVAQPTIQKITGSNRIFVELPGVKDRATVRRKLVTTANLEFYEVYDNAGSATSPGIGSIIFDMATENELSKALFGNQQEEIEEPIIDTNAISIDTGAAPQENNLLAPLEGEGDELLSEVEGDTSNSAELSREESLKKY